MKYRQLGSSDLHVSEISLGSWLTYGVGVDDSNARACLNRAFEVGINFIDTANVYEGYARYLGSPGGVAEEIVGKALRDRRDRMILATKVAAPVGPGAQDRGLSAVHILRELERSLRRLQTDVIDLYIIHWPDKVVPLEVTIRAIDTAMRQGKIRYFGASNHFAWQMCELLGLADRQLGPRIVSAQIPYSLLRRELHNDLSFCQQHRVGVTPYQSLQGGLLTGKYRRGQPAPTDSRAAEKPEWLWKQDERDRFDVKTDFEDHVGIASYLVASGRTTVAASYVDQWRSDVYSYRLATRLVEVCSVSQALGKMPNGKRSSNTVLK